MPDAQISLLQFLQAISKRKPEQMDIHWMPQTVLLQPDKVRYGMIGRLENFDADFSAIMQRIAPSFVETYGAFNHSPHRTGAAEKLAELVGPQEEALIRQIYADDFAVFGYDTALPAPEKEQMPQAPSHPQSGPREKPCRIPADVRIFLHIGQMKTGTTALQEALNRHRADLLEQGILYPQTGALPRHSDLAWSYWPPAQITGWVKSKYNARSPEANIDTIESEIVASGAKSVIISAEEFSLRPARLYASLLERWRNNLHVIVYLRRQDEMIESMYKQNVLNQGITTPFDGYVRGALDSATKLGKRLNYNDFLVEWETIAGRKGIHVALYEGESRNDLWRNFLHTADVSCEFDIQLKRSNISLPPEFIEFVRRTNAYIPKPHRHKFITDTLWLNQLSTVEGRPLCSDDLRRKILAHFRDQNRAVAQRYFDRTELFQP